MAGSFSASEFFKITGVNPAAENSNANIESALISMGLNNPFKVLERGVIRETILENL